MLTTSGVSESWKFGVFPWSASHVLTKVKRPTVLRHYVTSHHSFASSVLISNIPTYNTGPAPSSLGIQHFRGKGTRAKRLVVCGTWCGISLGHACCFQIPFPSIHLYNADILNPTLLLPILIASHESLDCPERRKHNHWLSSYPRKVE